MKIKFSKDVGLFEIEVQLDNAELFYIPFSERFIVTNKIYFSIYDPLIKDWYLEIKDEPYAKTWLPPNKTQYVLFEIFYEDGKFNMIPKLYEGNTIPFEEIQKFEYFVRNFYIMGFGL